MNKAAIYHEAKSRWAYPADEDTLHIRLRTGAGDIDSVKLIAVDPFLWHQNGRGGYTFDTKSIHKIPMACEYHDELFDYWFCEVRNNPTKRLRYCFILKGCDEEKRYTSYGFKDAGDPDDVSQMEHWFNFPYLNSEDVQAAPQWAERAVWYQIFCDRFARAETSGAGEEPCVAGGSSSAADAGKVHLMWGEEPDESDSPGHQHLLYGGNLRGVCEKLPYIAQMGFSAIYFTPIFESPTSHKYDTTDYFRIDPQFGTNGDFRELVQKAHGLGIRIMLDAVFNHCGYNHSFFQDVIEKGKESRYYDYFHMLDEPVCGLPYHAFAFVRNMPKWNTASPEAREYLIGIAEYWIREYDIDGWRFDVSNEVSHDFWREMRSRLKKLKPDLLMVGENWDDAYPWLCAGQFDSVMNYGLLDPAVSFLAGKTDAAGFASALTRRVLAAYPKPVQKVLYNLLDCHDTDRLMTVCGGNAKAAMLGYVIQMTLGGAPSVYYGSEAGMEGSLHGGGNRRCMLWGEQSAAGGEQSAAGGEPAAGKDLRPLITRLIKLRGKHPSFRAVDVAFMECKKNLLAYRKQAEGETLLVLINNGNESVDANIPEGKYTDAMSGDALEAGQVTLQEHGFLLLIR